jgi:site-specific DNA-methyltransferase (adenine-specific)
MLGDCLERMAEIPDGSVDMVLCDLPYGTTACKWDKVIPMQPLWAQYRRVCKPNAAIVLTASQPFASGLVMTNLAGFKYEVIWEKDKPSDFALAARRTMKYHENILIFCHGRETYNPQMTMGAPNHSVGRGVRKKRNESGANTAVVTNKTDGLKHPKSVMKFNREPKPLHPTQKPVALMEYLIRTYTNEGETVLDNTMGSGTTGVACLRTNRHFIGIERDETYFAIARQRIESALFALPNASGEPRPLE